MLSFHEDFEYVKSALRLGALDYISKLRIEEDCTQSFMSISDMLGRKLQHLPVEPTAQRHLRQRLRRTAVHAGASCIGCITTIPSPA